MMNQTQILYLLKCFHVEMFHIEHVKQLNNLLHLALKDRTFYMTLVYNMVCICAH